MKKPFLNNASLLAILLTPLISNLNAMSAKEATSYINKYYKQRFKELKKERKAEFQSKVIKQGDLSLPFAYKKYGEKPKNGRSLHISMHGGGGTHPRVNDRQWRNQQTLYKPKEGIFLAPRAATNTWNLWHQSHIDPMFQKLIENCILFEDVNPNKVYLSGYSAGGDGAYQLAPRMADRWAAAAMMAGHPNDAKPTNLTNTPFFIQCGGKDTAFKRNEVAKQWGKKLEQLAKKHPGHYKNKWIVYPQHGHWMKLDCKQAIPWMAKFKRNPWPKMVHWLQDDVTHTRFFWLENEQPQKGQLIQAEVKGNTITLTTSNVPQITLRLHDALLNLDEAITVKNAEGKILYQGKVERSEKAIEHSLNQRLDKPATATAILKLKSL